MGEREKRSKISDEEDGDDESRQGRGEENKACDSHALLTCQIGACHRQSPQAF